MSSPLLLNNKSFLSSTELEQIFQFKLLLLKNQAWSAPAAIGVRGDLHYPHFLMHTRDRAADLGFLVRLAWLYQHIKSIALARETKLSHIVSRKFSLVDFRRRPGASLILKYTVDRNPVGFKVAERAKIPINVSINSVLFSTQFARAFFRKFTKKLPQKNEAKHLFLLRANAFKKSSFFSYIAGYGQHFFSLMQIFRAAALSAAFVLRLCPHARVFNFSAMLPAVLLCSRVNLSFEVGRPSLVVQRRTFSANRRVSAIKYFYTSHFATFYPFLKKKGEVKTRFFTARKFQRKWNTSNALFPYFSERLLKRKKSTVNLFRGTLELSRSLRYGGDSLQRFWAGYLALN